MFESFSNFISPNSFLCFISCLNWVSPFNSFALVEIKLAKLMISGCNLQLLEEMIDNGFPLTTEPNILREMIAPPNIVSKVLSVVTGTSSNVSNTLPVATASCVPWRKMDPKNTSNEVYVDLVEEMDAIISRYDQPFTPIVLSLSLSYLIMENILF
mgnify:CR=1 FL=1